uniref:Uncharacterized protein n=1 Tax=Panagrolaimus superbus TaxID=310955 RepID=A0A914Y4B3_9BILA
MRILLYSDDLEEQDVIDKLFVYLYQFLSQVKTVCWMRRKQLNLLPNEEVCKDLKMEFLENLLLYYYGRRFRYEITNILSDLWFKESLVIDESIDNEIEKKVNEAVDYLFVDLCDADEEFIDGMLPILLEIEGEMKKINPESEVITTFSDEIFDKDTIEGFKLVWNSQLHKL